MTPRLIIACAGLAALAGCAAPGGGGGGGAARVAPFADQNLFDRRDGRCIGRVLEPAVVETLTVQTTATDAAGAPAYRTETRQRIVRERRERLFEAVCPEDYGPVFVASLQRALAARNAYSGPVSGAYDAPTRAALRRFQAAAGGPDSVLVARATARALGLVTLRGEEIAALG